MDFQNKMANMSLTHYLTLVARCWTEKDGPLLASLLSLRHEHVLSSYLRFEGPDPMVARFIEQPLYDIVISHLKCIWYLITKNYLDAYQQQSNIMQLLIKVNQLQKEDNWCLPVMYALCSDLRLVAQNAEKSISGETVNPGEILKKAAERLMECFRVCAAGNRSLEDDTKKIGMLTLVNQLFKVYFRINKLQLCKPLIRAIELSAFKDCFSLSQQITYRYFIGRKAVYDCNYKAADEYLTFAFENCHKLSKKNKRLILIYLVPVKILMGYIPKKQLLEKYDLVQFWELVQVVREGNLLLLDKLLEKYETFFIQSGIYLIVEKLKSVAYRNLFRKVFMILNTHQIPVESLQVALHFTGQTDVNLEETQCIVANLIYDGKIKGYMSHQHRKLVVSKQNPFPLLSSLSK